MNTTNPPDLPLSADRRERLLRLARLAVSSAVADGVPEPPPRDDPELLRRRAAFVTLRSRGSGELRGCKGEATARRALVDSVISGAVGAATDDPRFRPASVDEVPGLRIEISALTEPRPILPDRIELGRHGLILARGGRPLGLLLPQVPAQHGMDVAGFLEALGRKARVPRARWADDPSLVLLGFEAEVWAEPDPTPGG
ncbi:AmmeMemoRadiSam system protein A [Tautonia plasticadhaerens]|uniref:AmmeMemoRadiSam system protein A n=1 Tax=Tautonia plasticadhaerens TaxID=2527974 RepID=UPI0018D20693|nr:AmmeMemoRadiSam system protein A [Tautonia plasticadhaerens]